MFVWKNDTDTNSRIRKLEIASRHRRPVELLIDQEFIKQRIAVTAEMPTKEEVELLDPKLAAKLHSK